MAKRKDIRDQNSQTKDSGDTATTSTTSEIAAAAGHLAEDSIARPQPKLPLTAQLADSVSAAVPPRFLREHENRVIATKPAPAKPAGKEKPKSRFPLLAATLALAAGLGGAAGAIGVPALINLSFGPATAATAADERTADIQELKGLAAQLTTDIAALRTAAEQSSKAAAAQFGKLAERLDRAERAQADPVAKLAKISETLERLERRATTPPPPAALPAAAPAHNDVTGSVAPPVAEAKPKPTILEDYIVRKVLDGVALVEGRRGIVEVEPGSNLPGAGRVEEIRRQDGRWVVVTSKGLIVPGR